MDRDSVTRAAKVHRGDAGVTLIEMMIATGVMAVAFLLLFGAIFSISDTTTSTSDRAVAQSHINSMLEELQTTRLPDILQYQPPGLQGLGAAERIEVALMVPGAEEALMLPAAADAVDPAALPNPTEIRITVTWLDRAGRPMQTQGTVFVRR